MVKMCTGLSRWQCQIHSQSRGTTNGRPYGCLLSCSVLLSARLQLLGLGWGVGLASQRGSDGSRAEPDGRCAGAEDLRKGPRRHAAQSGGGEAARGRTATVRPRMAAHKEAMCEQST